MPRFVGCLIVFQCWFEVSLAGAMCGKGKFIDSSSSLVRRRVEFFEAKAESCAESHH